jgi:hypothetical protein
MKIGGFSLRERAFLVRGKMDGHNLLGQTLTMEFIDLNELGNIGFRIRKPDCL